MRQWSPISHRRRKRDVKKCSSARQWANGWMEWNFRVSHANSQLEVSWAGNKRLRSQRGVFSLSPPKSRRRREKARMIDGFVNVYRRFMKILNTPLCFVFASFHFETSAHRFCMSLLLFLCFNSISSTLPLFFHSSVHNPLWNFLIVCNLSFDDALQSSLFYYKLLSLEHFSLHYMSLSRVPWGSSVSLQTPIRSHLCGDDGSLSANWQLCKFN